MTIRNDSPTPMLMPFVDLRAVRQIRSAVIGHDRGGVHAESIWSHSLDHSTVFTLPPLDVLWLEGPL